jgi:hypothetical protein
MVSPDSSFQAGAPVSTNPTNIRSAWPVISLAAACLLWAGMVLGISVLEAPVKFTAPTLTRAIGMDVGRVVFSAFSLVQLVWSLITFLLLVVFRPYARVPRLLGGLLLLIWLIVGIQHGLLLPMLVERSLMIMGGKVPPPSPVHALYSSTEMVKLIALITCGVLAMKSLMKREE